MAIKIIAKNKRAYFDYEILDKLEAGIQLLGSEVKSIKNGEISLNEAYVRIEDDQLWLWNAHVPQYRHSSDKGYNPIRSRRLLVKKRELVKLAKKVAAGKLTIMPLKIYLSHGLVKLEIGLARGKKKHEKQRRIKERDLKRELHREQIKFMVK